MRSLARWAFLPLALCALACWLVGCPGGSSSSGSGSTGTGQTYFPLTVGNHWVYQQQYSDGTFKDTCTADVGAQTTLAGNAVFPISYVEGAHADTPFTIFANWDAKGLELYEVDTLAPLGTVKATGTPPALFLPASAPTTQQWSLAGSYIVSSDGATLNSGTFTNNPLQIVGTETVTVPAGTFANAVKCLVSVTQPGTSNTMTAYYWLAPGVGLVKGQDIKTNGNGLTLVLQSYTVK